MRKYIEEKVKDCSAGISTGKNPKHQIPREVRKKYNYILPERYTTNI